LLIFTLFSYEWDEINHISQMPGLYVKLQTAFMFCLNVLPKIDVNIHAALDSSNMIWFNSMDICYFR